MNGYSPETAGFIRFNDTDMGDSGTVTVFAYTDGEIEFMLTDHSMASRHSQVISRTDARKLHAFLSKAIGDTDNFEEWEEIEVAR